MTDSLARSLLPPPADSLGGTLLPPAPDSLERAFLEPPPARDTVVTRLEIGGSFDYTNEVYYLDALVDTTFRKPQRFQTPQSRFAGVLLAGVDGSRGRRATTYSLTNEIAYGDLLRREAISGLWETRFAPEWHFFVTPSFEYRWDRTLGRNLEEYHATSTARLRREGWFESTAGEVGLLGEWLHTDGIDARYLLDRQVGGVVAALDHNGWGRGDWRIDYVLRARTFPDSVARNHFEHDSEFHTRWGLPGGSLLELGAELIRRVTMQFAPSSADNFWLERVTADPTLFGIGRWSWPTHLELESQQYDVQDSLLYFDYRVLRAQSGPRWAPRPEWMLWLAPRAEWLDAELNPGESYRELAAAAQLDVFAQRSLWNVLAAVGRRFYKSTSLAEGTQISLHSDYTFGEMDWFADQGLGRHWRLRALADVRVEVHDEPIENGTSLYFSIDVRRLF